MGGRDLRIAQLIETLGMGGAENLAVRIANALAARGHDSHLFVVEGPGPLSDRVDPAVAVDHFDFTRSSVRNPLTFAGSLLSGRRILARHVAAHGVEIVQTHLPGANFWGLLAQVTGVTQVVATVHNNEEFRYGRSDNRLLLALRKAAYRRIVRRCGGVVVVSEAVRDSLLAELGLPRAAGDRIEVVTNGVEIPEPPGPEGRRRARARLGVAEDTPLVLAAGRLSEQKNFADLVRVGARLAAAEVPHRLVIAGEGELGPELARQVAELGLDGTIDLPGVVPGLDRLCAGADLFAMTSRWEGLPLVLLEAMAAGLPVVAYDIPGVREVVVPEETGILVPLGDAEALAAAMAGLLAAPERRRRMGARARARVAAEFSFEGVVRRLEGIYTGVLNPASGRRS